MQDLNSPTFPNGNSEREICNQGQSCIKIKISKKSIGISNIEYQIQNMSKVFRNNCGQEVKTAN
jgi:hypothetical protein